MDGVPCGVDEIYALRPRGSNDCVWLTDVGEFVWKKISARKASLRHPRMVEITKSLYVNRRRLRRVCYARARLRAVLDNGLEFPLNVRAGVLAARLGLTSLVYLEPYCAGLYRDLQLRDWPYTLAIASRKQLARDFVSGRQLIAHVVWQRFRQACTRPTSYRRLWYDEIAHVLVRAGFPDDGGYETLQQLMRTFVGEDRFWTFRGYGFKDPEPAMRRIGAQRPEVVLVAEKESLAERAFALAAEFGISCIVLSGQPSLLATEFFAWAIGLPEVILLAYTDYDPGGWIVARSFAAQLARYDIRLQRPVEFLVRAELFTPEERELLAIPLSTGSPSWEEKARDWMAECGGVDGKPLAIHADHLPVERLRKRLVELVGV